ncbi:ABC transporter substrate-binding protein [Bradyrhizobium sp. LHD-71]|uniref:ABC transporter substrate-binding protein n=1 Tax=Bradyrhizobium sp. LHD-71 TaxID=3072141 RepID=UPI00280F36B6|nr:ABC transporter substrate-binding protein [Bradyrhizobium sp. LHD-71]MDQ8730329.1 ABC transporter substrate-binding protein [Bradyrhizobium sp. LHD-71]
MITRRTVVAAACTTAVWSFTPAIVRAATKATLRMKWLPQASFAGYYRAQEKGYYRDEGLDLDIIPGGPNVLTENLVATDADIFGLSGGTDSVLVARDKGLPVVCFGLAHQVTPFVFVARRDGPVKTVRDMKGKRVVAWFTGANYVLASMLAKAGLGPDDVTIQPQQVSVTPFTKGEVDVCAATVYNELYTIEQRLGRENLRTFVAEDSGITVPRDTLITSEKIMRDNPAIAAGFLRASIKGWKDAFANPASAIDTLLRVAPTLDRTHQEYSLRENRRLLTAGLVPENGLLWLDMKAIQSAHDFFLQSKVISKPVELEKTFRVGPLQTIPVTERRA